jgi:hypothetical protein
MRCWFGKFLLLSLVLAAVSPLYGNSVSLAGDEGISNLRWRNGVVRISISSSVLRENPNIKRDSDVAGAIRRSIDAWSSVANIDLQQLSSDKQSASPSGPVGDGVSLITVAQTPENVLLFSKDPENAAATTRIFYNKRGMITEADIVLNPFLQFSTDGTLGTFDLQSTLTHEIGHLLGLAHSPVFGATMHANYGKNGVFGIQNFSSRTLSADDVAAVRSIYGVRTDDEECCGTIQGRLAFGGKQGKTAEIWVEDANGSVQASTESTDGEFRFTSLGVGQYRVFAQEAGRTRSASPAREIGEAMVERGGTAAITAKPTSVARDFDLAFVGFNGQLSEMAVSLSPGRTYTIYLGGRNLDPRRLAVSFTSPFIRAVPGTMRSLDYGDEISVVSLEVRVSSRASAGDYTIYAETEKGGKRALIGGLTIENFPTFSPNLTTFQE